MSLQLQHFLPRRQLPRINLLDNKAQLVQVCPDAISQNHRQTSHQAIQMRIQQEVTATKKLMQSAEKFFSLIAQPSSRPNTEPEIA